MINKQDINKILFYPLNEDQIKNILFKYNVLILPYNELSNIDNIDELIKKYDLIILLYLNSVISGHWCCLYFYNNVIYFFDSYGGKIDNFFNYHDKKINKLYNIHPKLSYLLYKSSYKIDYFDKPLQNRYINKKLVQTCGFWCIGRFLCKQLNNNEFYKMFKNNNYILSDQKIIYFILQYIINNE